MQAQESDIKPLEKHTLYKWIALTKYKLGKYSEAIEYWEKAIEISKKYKLGKFSAFTEYWEIDITTIKDDRLYLTVEEWVVKAYKKIITLNIKQGRLDIAKELYKQLITKYPGQVTTTDHKKYASIERKSNSKQNQINNSGSI